MWFKDEQDALARLTPQIGEGLARAVSANLCDTVQVTTFGKVGHAQLGGRPSLPVGTAWPERRPSADANDIASRADPRKADQVKRAAARSRPLTFLMEVALGAPGIGADDFGLPNHGHLLFFYDLELGPLDNGRESCRVVWTGTAGLATAAPAAGVLTSQPAKAALKRVKAPLAPASIESRIAMPQILKGEDQGADAFVDLMFDREAGSWTRLGGPADPIGNDPRYDAAALQLYRSQAITAAQWKNDATRLQKTALEHAVIAQVEISTCLPGEGHEGIVFFLIRKEDLAKREFGKALAFHQKA